MKAIQYRTSTDNHVWSEWEWLPSRLESDPGTAPAYIEYRWCDVPPVPDFATTSD